MVFINILDLKNNLIIWLINIKNCLVILTFVAQVLALRESAKHVALCMFSAQHWGVRWGASEPLLCPVSGCLDYTRPSVPPHSPSLTPQDGHYWQVRNCWHSYYSAIKALCSEAIKALCSEAPCPATQVPRACMVCWAFPKQEINKNE